MNQVDQWVTEILKRNPHRIQAWFLGNGMDTFNLSRMLALFGNDEIRAIVERDRQLSKPPGVLEPKVSFITRVGPGEVDMAAVSGFEKNTERSHVVYGGSGIISLPNRQIVYSEASRFHINQSEAGSPFKSTVNRVTTHAVHLWGLPGDNSWRFTAIADLPSQ